MLTDRELRQRLQLHGMRVSKQNGEYRISYAEMSYDASEPSAYYTDDPDDAYHTGISMRRHLSHRQVIAAVARH